MRARNENVFGNSEQGVAQEVARYKAYRKKRVSTSTYEKEEYCVVLLLKFVNDRYRELSSLVDVSKEDFIKTYKVYLLRNGYQIIKKRKRSDRKKDSYEENEKIKYARNIIDFLSAAQIADNRPEKEKDIQDVRMYAIQPRMNPVNRRYRLDFSRIKQDSMRKEVKEVVVEKITHKSMTTVKRLLIAATRLSQYLAMVLPEINSLTEITRDIIAQYIVYIRMESGLKQSSYQTELSALNTLLDEIGRIYEKNEMTEMVYRTDRYRKIKTLPQVYSDREMSSLIRAVNGIEDIQIRRVIYIILKLGLRCSDGLTLRQDCMTKRGEIKMIAISQPKTGLYYKDIDDELERVIYESIDYSRRKYNEKEYVFVRKKGLLYSYETITYHLMKAIRNTGIKRDDGEEFVFSFNTARHTYATRLANMGVEDGVIAASLGHKTPKSVSHYRKVTNKVLAEKTRSYRVKQDEEVLKLVGGVENEK